jgi:hypothetical protein
VSWYQRFLRRLFPVPFTRLLNEARKRGRVSMQEVDIGKGRVGWYVSIRPAEVGKGGHAHRYAWTGQDEDLTDALEEAVEEARDFPRMIDMTEDMCKPRLGGKEFDE